MMFLNSRGIMGKNLVYKQTSEMTKRYPHFDLNFFVHFIVTCTSARRLKLALDITVSF